MIQKFQKSLFDIANKFGISTELLDAFRDTINNAIKYVMLKKVFQTVKVNHNTTKIATKISVAVKVFTRISFNLTTTIITFKQGFTEIFSSLSLKVKLYFEKIKKIWKYLEEILNDVKKLVHYLSKYLLY